MRLVLPLVAAFVPAIILPHALLYFDVTPKVSGILIGTAIALMLWRGVLGFGSKLGRLFLALVAVQLLSLAVSTALSSHPDVSLNGGNWRRFGLIVQSAIVLYAALVAIDARGDRTRMLWYLRALVISGCLVGTYGILQYCGIDPFLPGQAYRAGEGEFTIVRPPATLGHASYFATFLVYVAFAATGLILCETNRIWRGLGVLALGIAGAGVLLSGTRAAVLGLIAGGIVLAFWQRPRPRRWQIALAGTAVVAAGLFYWSPIGERLRARTHWAIEEPLGGARPLLWRDALRMSASHPLFGFGPETFGSEFPRYQSLELARAYPDFSHESPHNIFIDAFDSQGILGFAALAGLCAWAWFAAQRGRTQHPKLAGVALAAMAGGIVAQQFTSFTVPTALCFWLMAGLLAALVEERSTVPSRAWYWRAPAWACAVALTIFAVRLLAYDAGMARFSRSIAAGDLGGAVSAYQSADRWRPRGSSADLYYSRELAAFFQRSRDVRLKLLSWGPAVQAAMRAPSTVEDRHNAYYNLAAFFATQNDAPNVERSLQSAIAWAPNWFKPHWALAQLYARTGHPAEAGEEARKAAERSGPKGPEALAMLRLGKTDQGVQP